MWFLSFIGGTMDNKYESFGSRRMDLSIGQFVEVVAQTAATKKNDRDTKYQIIEFVQTNSVKICDSSRKVYTLHANRLKLTSSPSQPYLYSLAINYQTPSRSNIIFHINDRTTPLQYITEYLKDTGGGELDRYIVIYNPVDKEFQHIKAVCKNSSKYQFVELVDTERVAILSKFQFIRPLMFNGSVFDHIMKLKHPNYQRPILVDNHLYWTDYTQDDVDCIGGVQPNEPRIIRIVKLISFDNKFLNTTCYDLSTRTTLRIPCYKLNIMTPDIWRKGSDLIIDALVGKTQNIISNDGSKHIMTSTSDSMNFEAYVSLYSEFTIRTPEHFRLFFESVIKPELLKGDGVTNNTTIPIVRLNQAFISANGAEISMPARKPCIVREEPTLHIHCDDSVQSNGNMNQSMPIQPLSNFHSVDDFEPIQPVNTASTKKGHLMELMNAFLTNMKNAAQNAGQVAGGRTMSNNLERFVKAKAPMLGMFLNTPAGRTGEMIIANVILALVDTYKPNSPGYRLAVESYCNSTSAVVGINGADFLNEFLTAIFDGVDISQFEAAAAAAAAEDTTIETPAKAEAKK